MPYEVRLKDEYEANREYDNINFMTHGWVELYDESGERNEYIPSDNIVYIRKVRK